MGPFGGAGRFATWLLLLLCTVYVHSFAHNAQHHHQLATKSHSRCSCMLIARGRRRSRLLPVEVGRGRKLSHHSIKGTSICASTPPHKHLSRLSAADDHDNVAGPNVSFREDFWCGVNHVNDHFYPLLWRSLALALPPALALTGVLPFAVYYFRSPSSAVGLTRWIVRHTILFGRGCTLISEPVSVLAAIVIFSPLFFVLIQVWICIDVWDNSVDLLTALKEAWPDLRNDLKKAKAEFSRMKSGSIADSEWNISDKINRIRGGTRLPGGGPKPDLLSTIFYGPVLEEVAFRFILYGGLKWLIRRRKQQTGESNQPISTRDRSRLTILTTLTSALFALSHIGKHEHKLTKFLTAPIAPGKEWAYLIAALQALTGVVLSIVTPFVVSTNAFLPMYESNGLAGSIGAHMCWNFRVQFIRFDLLFLILRRAFRAVKQRFGILFPPTTDS